MIYFGLVLTSITEFLERFISVGGFFLSPGRIFLLALGYWFLIVGIYRAGTGFDFGKTAKYYLLFVGFLLSVIGVSVVMSDDLMYSLKRVLNASSLLVLPALVVMYLRINGGRYDYQVVFWKTSRLLIHTGVFVALFGFLQAATGFLQMKAEMRPLLGIPLPRINSVMVDANFLAFFLVFPICLAMAGGKHNEHLPDWRYRGVAVLLMLGAFVLTGSRGGMLMLLVAGISLMLTRYLKQQTSKIAMIEVSVIALLPILVLAYAYFGFERVLQVADSYDTSTESGASRLYVWYAGIRLYLDHPLFGVGPGNFVSFDKGNYLPTNYVLPWVAANISALAGHSNALEMLVESGPAALAGYLGLNVFIYLRLLRAATTAPYMNVCRYIFVAANVGNLFITYYPMFMMMILGIWLYCIEVAEEKRVAQPARQAQPRPHQEVHAF